MKNWRFWIFVGIFFIVFAAIFVSCAKRQSEADRTTAFIEDYISQLKEIEIPPHNRWTALTRMLENLPQDVDYTMFADDSLFMQLRDAINETVAANKTAVEEFRTLALRQKPAFVEDTLHLLLRTATVFLGQSYEMRNEAMAWFNRYISLGTMRFLEEYREKMAQAMEHSRQAFFFLTMARVRQRVATGDTLDMTVNEFLNIPEMPTLPQNLQNAEENEEESESEEGEV